MLDCNLVGGVTKITEEHTSCVGIIFRNVVAFRKAVCLRVQ